MQPSEEFRPLPHIYLSARRRRQRGPESGPVRGTPFYSAPTTRSAEKERPRREGGGEMEREGENKNKEERKRGNREKRKERWSERKGGRPTGNTYEASARPTIYYTAFSI